MKAKIRFIAIVLAVLYAYCYSPIALITIGYGGISVFNIYDSYKYCQEGRDLCLYSFMLYMYIICLFYIVYRILKWLLMMFLHEIRRVP